MSQEDYEDALLFFLSEEEYLKNQQ